MNHIWVIEGLTEKWGWIPLVIPRGIQGVHYTRKKARELKRKLDKIDKRERLQHRVRKYQAVVSHSDIRSMEQFQKKYFPKSVGIECPYCGKKLDKPDGNIPFYSVTSPQEK